jgi:glycosyltransferase involved in cell wall biosynthesis
MMKNVIVRAPLLSISGYGEHSRQVFQWATSIPSWNVSAHVVNWGNTTWYLNPESEDGLIGQIMSRSTNQTSGFDISIQVQLPDEWDTNLAHFNIGVTAAVETDKCNPAWVDACNKMNCIIVPSNHVKETLETTGKITCPIYVIGEWYLTKIDTAKDPLPLDLTTSFNFLIISQMTSQNSNDDRKNILDTLKWTLDAFKDDKDVGIILKTNFGKGTKIDREFTQNFLKKFIQENRKSDFPKIHLLHGNLSSEEVASLYRHPSIKALINLTRGEGYGLPLLEATVSGLPVITTNWSGHLDFLKYGKFVGIDYTLVDIPATRIDDRIFVKGTKWAQPLEADYKKRVVKFRHSPDIPSGWARELKEKCKEHFSRESILKKYQSLTRELGLV